MDRVPNSHLDSRRGILIYWTEHGHSRGRETCRRATGTASSSADVSLAVEPGEFVAVLGRNGSGKSTLIKAVQNLLENVEGTVRCAGEDVFGLTPRQVASRIAYVPQMAEPAFEFTVEEVVADGPLRPPGPARAGLGRGRRGGRGGHAADRGRRVRRQEACPS